MLHGLASWLVEWTLWLGFVLVSWLIIDASVPILLRIFDAP